MTKTLVMTRGLPGSGKTTWAKAQKRKLENQPSNVFVGIVCKDDIRRELEATGWKWSHEAEKEVILIRNNQIRTHFGVGCSVVIVADTNFGKHKDALKAVAEKCGAQFKIQDFTHVPLETCIERDAKREKPVGEGVIVGMYEKYIALPAVKPYIPNLEKPLAVICDLDGTLAIHKDRSPYDYAKCDTDILNTNVSGVLKLLTLAGYQVIFVSGRDGSAREKTQAWLEANHFKYPWLFMRDAGDHRKDCIVKQELFDQNIRDNFNVKFVLDDRDQVVKMWRGMGLECWQVAEGNF